MNLIVQNHRLIGSEGQPEDFADLPGRHLILVGAGERERKNISALNRWRRDLENCGSSLRSSTDTFSSVDIEADQRRWPVQFEKEFSRLTDQDLVVISADLGDRDARRIAPKIARTTKRYGVPTVGLVELPRGDAAKNARATVSASLDALLTTTESTIILPAGNQVSRGRRCLANTRFHLEEPRSHIVRVIADLCFTVGLICLDFMDVTSAFSAGGQVYWSLGFGRGRDRARQAAAATIHFGEAESKIRMADARAILVRISGGLDMTLDEVDEVLSCHLLRRVGSDCDCVIGAFFDERLAGLLMVDLLIIGGRK